MGTLAPRRRPAPSTTATALSRGAKSLCASNSGFLVFENPQLSSPRGSVSVVGLLGRRHTGLTIGDLKCPRPAGPAIASGPQRNHSDSFH